MIAIAILFVALPVLAQKTASPTCPSKPIVLALFEFGNLYRDGTGLDKDISDIMAERSGCRFDVRVMQRQYTWPALQDGSIDMTLSAVALPERTAFSWATPYLWMKYMVVLRKDVDPSIHSKADFIADPNLKLGTGHAYVHGRSYDEFVTQLRNIGRVVDVADTDRLFKMFKADRFQAVISTQIAYTSYLKDDIQADKVRIEDWSPGKPKDELNLLIS
ncbi:MAG TPA: ABC transporter substrate-binding protein, partial [Burkholderiaceae bacterium]|nr:ABC transporter substrate-binding protein [Burkholderiaceae bacterium]